MDPSLIKSQNLLFHFGILSLSLDLIRFFKINFIVTNQIEFFFSYRFSQLVFKTQTINIKRFRYITLFISSYTLF